MGNYILLLTQRYGQRAPVTMGNVLQLLWAVCPYTTGNVSPTLWATCPGYDEECKKLVLNGMIYYQYSRISLGNYLLFNSFHLFSNILP